MRRRRFIALVGGLASGMAGCSSLESEPPPTETRYSEILENVDAGDEPTVEETETVSLDLPESRTYPLWEWHRLGDVRVKTKQVERFASVKYNNPQEGEIKLWDPGSERSIVTASYMVENLSLEKKDWPVWSNFHLVSHDGVHKPKIETPDGTSVSEIGAGDSMAMAGWVESEGLRRNHTRSWDGVYVAPSNDVTGYATKWTRPEDPVYWRPEDTPF